MTRWLLFLLLATPAFGDSIDRGLYENGEKLVEACKKRGYKHVGAVRFKVRVRGKAASFVEPLSSNMADRVENALIVCDRDESLSAVLRGVGEQAAARDEVASLGSAAACRKVFAGKYDVAWGRARVRPDALLTGLVAFSASRREVTVSLEAVTADGKRARLLSFKVAVDRSVLSDAGLAFTLSPHEAAVRGTRSLERSAQDAVGKGKRLVTVSEKKQGDDRMILTIKNSCDQRVGVVLRVAGRNVIDKETEQASECARLIMKAKSEMKLEGFLRRDGKGRQAFRLYKVRGVTTLPPPPTPLDPLSGPQVANLCEVSVFIEGETKDEIEQLSLRGFGVDWQRDEAWKRDALATELKVRAKLPLNKVGVRTTTRPEVAPRPTGFAPVRTMSRPRLVEYSRLTLLQPLK